MTQIEITDQARIRIQQRGIQEQIQPILFKYGKKHMTVGVAEWCLWTKEVGNA